MNRLTSNVPANGSMRRSQMMKSSTIGDMHSSVVVSPKVFQFDTKDKNTHIAQRKHNEKEGEKSNQSNT